MNIQKKSSAVQETADTDVVKDENESSLGGKLLTQTFDETSRNYTASRNYNHNGSVSKDIVKDVQVNVYSKRLKILIYISYILMTTCEGAFEPLGGSLYNKFETQLNTSSSHIAYILSVKPICSAIAAIITAAMLDYVENSHIYCCIISIISAVTLAFIPFIKSLYLMFGAFGVVGYYIGAVFVSYPVYIFRLFPENQNRALFFCMVIYGISKTIMPLLIDVSLVWFGSYGFALWIVSFLLLIVSVLMLCLPTPKHDPLRSAKKTIGTEYKSLEIERINESVNTNIKAKRYSYLLIILLVLMMFTFSSFQSGTVNFIQTFITKHLNHNASIARYLISSYYFGQLFYRILITILFKEVNPIISMCISNIALLIIGLIFVAFGNISFIKDTNIWLLYVIYICIGFFASTVFPGVYKWGELIKTVGGLLSGIFVVAFSFGDAGMVAFVGTLIDKFGPYIIPYPIGAYIFASFCVTFIGAFVYWRYCVIKNKIINLM
eukprot:401302_1